MSESRELDVLLIGAQGGRMIPAAQALAQAAHELARELREYERNNGPLRDDLTAPDADSLRKCVGDLLDITVTLAHRAEAHGLLDQRHEPITTIPRPPD